MLRLIAACCALITFSAHADCVQEAKIAKLTLTLVQAGIPLAKYPTRLQLAIITTPARLHPGEMYGRALALCEVGGEENLPDNLAWFLSMERDQAK